MPIEKEALAQQHQIFQVVKGLYSLIVLLHCQERIE